MQRKRLIIVSGGTLLAALGLSVGAQRPSKALATNKQSVLQSVIHRELTGPHIPDNQRFRLKLLTTPFHPHAIPPTAWQFPTILFRPFIPFRRGWPSGIITAFKKPPYYRGLRLNIPQVRSCCFFRGLQRSPGNPGSCLTPTDPFAFNRSPEISSGSRPQPAIEDNLTWRPISGNGIPKRDVLCLGPGASFLRNSERLSPSVT